MRTNEASANACKHCGNNLPGRNLGRICPACLMAEVLDVSEVLDGGNSEDTDLELSRESAVPDSLEGSTISLDGRYKLLQKIGEDGFGTVSMAEQSNPDKLEAEGVDGLREIPHFRRKDGSVAEW